MAAKRKPNIKNKRDAVATHCGLDYAEVEDYRYHYGHTSQAVYAFTDFYICITKGNQKPATHRDGSKWNWIEVPNAYINIDGFKVWKAGTEIV